MIDDQTETLARLGIPAVAITRDSLKEDPQIWKKVDAGKYRVIYATPEVALRPSCHFQKITLGPESNEFKKNLTLIAIDEAHTVWGYRRFRAEFKHIGKLRLTFPEVPFAALSATMPPHVVGYVQQVCRMNTPAECITMKGRRKNIDLIVTEQYGKITFEPLLDLIPPDSNDLSKIPQTMIFVDSVISARKLALAMRRRILQDYGASARPRRLIRTYYSSIDVAMKIKTHDFLNNGTARIVICTDSMSLGVDFANIERVIQWGVDKRLTMNTLVQRIGRVARSPLTSLVTQGVAIVYAPKELLKAVNGNWKDAWEKEQAKNNNTSASQDPRTNNEEPRLQIREELLSLPVQHDTMSFVHRLQNEMYLTVRAEPSSDQSTRRRYQPFQDRIRRTSILERIDPAIILFLCTSGCRHRCILSYLHYPDIFEDDQQQSWCCDNCVLNKGLSLEDCYTAGFSPVIGVRNETLTKPTRLKAPAPRGRQTRLIDPRKQEQVEAELCKWRQSLWQKLVDRSILQSDVPYLIVLPPAAMSAIMKNLRRIVSESALCDVLKQAKFCRQSSLLRPKDIHDLFTIIDAMLSSEVRGGTRSCI